MRDWLNITERHARELVERGAIPYRKVRHLFALDRAAILDAMNQAVSRLHAYEKSDDDAEDIGA